MLTFPKTTTDLASIVSQLPVEQQEIEQIWSALTKVEHGMIDQSSMRAAGLGLSTQLHIATIMLLQKSPGLTRDIVNGGVKETFSRINEANPHLLDSHFMRILSKASETSGIVPPGFSADYRLIVNAPTHPGLRGPGSGPVVIKLEHQFSTYDLTLGHPPTVTFAGHPQPRSPREAAELSRSRTVPLEEMSVEFLRALRKSLDTHLAESNDPYVAVLRRKNSIGPPQWAIDLAAEVDSMITTKEFSFKQRRDQAIEALSKLKGVGAVDPLTLQLAFDFLTKAPERSR